MVDWTKSMQQTYEYYMVDPGTWKDTTRISTVQSCTISRDSEADTLGSATIDITGSIGECYVRVYLVTLQNGVTEKHPLGTVLVQSPLTDFDGKVTKVSLDAYTPLLELKENYPPLGYSLFKDENIMQAAYRLTRENTRAPAVQASSDKKLKKDFVADPDENWLKYLTSLIANANYTFHLDEMGRVLYAPKQDTAALQPVWTYDDGNSSILYPELSINRDLYGIPNVVEVVYSDEENSYFARVVNDDPNSPVSTVNRGREIVHRETNPSFGDGEGNEIPTEKQLQVYARQLLRDLSSVECKISYTHGYCGTRLGDCVRLNYSRAGFTDIKAKIISQSIKCTPGCPVSEKAVFTTKLWG